MALLSKPLLEYDFFESISHYYFSYYDLNTGAYKTKKFSNLEPAYVDDVCLDSCFLFGATKVEK